MSAAIASRVRAVEDAAVSGYAHAYVAIKPWKAYVDGHLLVDKWKRPRRFSTEEAAIAAATIEVTRRSA